jgi:hypothetical protein
MTKYLNIPKKGGGGRPSAGGWGRRRPGAVVGPVAVEAMAATVVGSGCWRRCPGVAAVEATTEYIYRLTEGPVAYIHWLPMNIRSRFVG